MNPAERRKTIVVDKQQLKERCRQLDSLIRIATPEMKNLYQQVSGSGYGIVLTDTDGVVLHYVGDPVFDTQARGSGLINGAVWNEQTQGTNGIGTCLVENKPVVVHQDEHFFVNHTVLTCAAAPIRNAAGIPIAALDASSTSTMAQEHTLALVNMSAQLIENRLFLVTYRTHYIARFHSRPEFVSTLGEGLISFNSSGAILAANRSALFHLGFSKARDLTNRTVCEIFDVPHSRLVEQASRKPFELIRLHDARDGRRFYATVQIPGTPAMNNGSRKDVVTSSVDTNGESNFSPLEEIEFGDPSIARSVEIAKQVVNSDIPLLLSGPTGTGKGVFAKAIHMTGHRAEKPFVAVNCAAIPESLIESEMFGYKGGAFTGANRQGSRGKIEQANGGTLFLDEIGDMPLPLQARLLRVLEEKEVVPLGGAQPVRVDIAIISATHRDLSTLINVGEFREDLYYRLVGVTLTLPPLCEREDKHTLIQHIMKLYTPRSRVPLEIEEDALAMLMSYGWPGNIRELTNVLKTTIALCAGHRITIADLPDRIRTDYGDAERPIVDASVTSERLSNPLATAEYTTLLRELEACHWNIAKAARRFKMSRNTLYRKMRRFGIAARR